MGINTPSFEAKNENTNKKLNNQIKEELVVKLNTRKNIGDLKEDFETNKEIVAYKDIVLNKFDILLGEGKISGLIKEKITDIYANLTENEDRYKMLKVLEEVIKLSKTGTKIDTQSIQNILQEFDVASPQLVMILGCLILIVGVFMFPVEGYVASIMLGIGTFGALKGAIDSTDLRHVNLLDYINNIIPDISEKHYKRIEDAVEDSIQDKSDILITISKELSESYKDRILTDYEITKLEIAIKNISTEED